MSRAEHGAEVWTVQQDQPAVRSRLHAFAALLTREERTRAERFVQPGDRERFTIGRALARSMLAAYGGGPPLAWSIVIDAHGRPELGARPVGAPDLRFNLSHTPGLVACALAIGREVGVDVEDVRRTVHYDVAERFFSPREVADLRALPPDEQALAFFDYWTLKESYIKARGLGLAIPLGQFTFVRHRDRPPEIEIDPVLQDDAATWQFRQSWASPHHRLAVALRRSGADVAIHVRDALLEATG